jgi:PAS domain S-box-containing protein
MAVNEASAGPVTESEQPYRAIFEATTDGMTISTLAGRLVDANPAICAMHGYTRDEFLALPPGGHVHPDYFAMRREFLNGIREGRGYAIRALDVRKDGSAFPVDVRAIPITYRGEPHVLAVLRDISEQIDTERLLEERVAARTRELSVLAEVAREVNSTLDLDSLIRVILDKLRLIIEHAGSSLILREGDELVQVGLSRPGLDQQTGVGVRYPLATSLGLWEPLERQEVVIIADVRDDSELAHAYQQTVGASFHTLLSYIRCWMAAPLVLKDEVIGFLAVSSTIPGTFDHHDAELLRAVAHHAATAIGNARLLAEAEERTRETQALLQVSHHLGSTLKLEPLLDVILDQIKTVADYDGAAIATHEHGQLRMLRRRAPTFMDPDHLDFRGFSADDSPEWQVVSRGEPVIIDDVRGDSPLAHAFRAHEPQQLETSHLSYVRSWMAVPLALTDRVIGVIILAHGWIGFYRPHHAELVTAIGTQAAAAIENARLYAQTEERSRELAAVLEVSQRVTSTLALEPVLNVILEQLQQVVDYRGATIGIIEGDELLVAGSRAVTPERSADKGMRITLASSGPIGDSILGRQPVIIGDVREDSPAAAAYRAINTGRMDQPTHSAIRAWMAVPLVAKDRVLGHLTMSQDVPNYFSARHADLALAFANYAAIAIENARLYEKASALAALEERQRLARELHDSVSQALFGIALGARTARRRLEQDPPKVGEALDYVLSLAEAGLTEMRALIFELRPESLEKEGLVIALTRQAAATHARHEIEVVVDLCEEPDAPLAIKEALYRVAQEAMHNAVKHARASRIDLLLAAGTEGLVMQVGDDGVGFDPGQDFAGHLGLHSMRERITSIGGTIDIASARGVGTRIRILTGEGASL